uniref:TIAM Rac1 associated GEF 2a n=1 Tax=Neogobius melanostomus TaxID=47308 RepID=A0A8C6SNS1_9GOBI
MGNSESQYSIQGPKGTILTGKPKPYSLKPRLSKDNALSPHSWWKSAPVGSGYKARCAGRGCLSPPKTRQPYSTRHYDYVTKRGSPSWQRSAACGIRKHYLSDDYEDNPYGAELNRSALNAEEIEVEEDQSSPRVVIKKDGSLRVEFTNTSGNPLVLDGANGPVQLLKFSPNLEPPSTPNSGDPNSIRNGSSLSSDGSWYDSPWGPATELCETEQPSQSDGALDNSPVHQLDSFIKQPPLSISDLYKEPTIAITFPTSGDLTSQLERPLVEQRTHRASFASVVDVLLEEECSESNQYSSYTLPCRRPKAHTPEFGFYKKDSIKNRIRRFSDWTGSLSRKKRKSQVRYTKGSKELGDAFDSGVNGLATDTSSPSQVSSLLWFPGSSRTQSSGAIHQNTNDALRQNIYENFMRELETGAGQGVVAERPDPSTGTEEGESSSESAEGSLEQLDLLFEKEQGMVRRAGWLSFKPLVTLHKDRKLELITRRKWKQYWVTLKGCTLLFYETYGKGSPEQDMCPRYALLAEDSIVQAVPEHPKKENVFCLSNSYGDVYLFQASNQTDLENWVTAVHSASASLLAKRQGKEDTVRLLRTQVRALLQKIDMDSKMKKMAELQLTVVHNPKNRKAIENQIQQWEQNLERFNMDLFRMRCYLASLQGGELPNPKSLLATASRPTKSTLARLGIFSVSSFHALICSRDEATLRRRSQSLTCRQRKRGLFSSLKGLDNLTRRGRQKRPSASQVRQSLKMTGHRRQHVRQQMQHIAGIHYYSKGTIKFHTCRLYVGFAVTGHVDGQENSRIFVSEVLPDGLANHQGASLSNMQRMCAWVSADTVCALYQEGTASPIGLMDDLKPPQAQRSGEMASGPRGEASLLRPCPKHMSVTERLRKVIQELVDTEKSYVKDLTCLFEIYLKPLQKETFLTLDEMESLFGSLPEMLDFQRVFLQTLEERIASSPDFSTLETPSQFKKLLFSLGGSFLYYADHFKLYSGFCANHIKVQKVLERAKTDQAFKEFLDARNPTKQHSSTLESYLIKPVQRVLKYPLLLRELVSLTDADSEEHYHLSEALKAMEKVASHINEMQKIYEDYGAVFDQLVAEQNGLDKEVTEISMGEFLMHSSAVWLNPHPSLGRMRKDPEMTVFVFKKAVILVYRESNKLKKKMVSTSLFHSDSDLFKFRWLIPLSALQVRLGNTAGTGAESSCIWELIHCRSEVEGRPETVFQLCSSVLESKVNIIKVIRSILRENVRRNMRSEGTLERNCKERLAPLRSTLASWRCKKPVGEFSSQTGNANKAGPDSDEGSQSSGTYSLSSATPLCPSSDGSNPASQQSWSCTADRPATSSSVKESDILSDEDDDGFSETRRDSGDSNSPTSAIEAEFTQLKLSEEAVLKGKAAPCVLPEGGGDTPELQPRLKPGHSNAVRRKGSSLRRNRGALLNMKEHSRSLDSPTDTAPADLNMLLEREFSVQSLTSVVNEDCFFDQTDNCATDCRNESS